MYNICSSLLPSKSSQKSFVGYRIPDTGYLIPDTGYRIPGIPTMRQHLPHCIIEVGFVDNNASVIVEAEKGQILPLAQMDAYGHRILKNDLMSHPATVGRQVNS